MKKIVKTSKEMSDVLDSFYKKSEADFVSAIKRTGFRLHTLLGVYTPKDTGWASQHWSMGLAVHNNVAVSIDTLTTFKIGDTINVFNNVPYIKRLDEGWSQQRPSGFTHIALADATQWLEAELKQIK